MNLTGKVVNVNKLGDETVKQMFNLMKKHYDNVDWHVFVEDLYEKDWVILLNNNFALKGFSTQMLIEYRLNGEKVNVVFSGDTIIDKDYWGSIALPVTFGKMMLEIKTQSAGKKLFWFLISKGFRTYRFLPVFFKTYYPGTDSNTDNFALQLLHKIAAERYGDKYNPRSSVISVDRFSQKVKPGLCDITETNRKNKHIAFFEQTNPGYILGEELACIARFDHENLTPFILKRIMPGQTIIENNIKSCHNKKSFAIH